MQQLSFELCMPLSSANTEDEERGFTFLKKVAKDCSNHHPDNVLTSCTIPTQVREDWNTHLGARTKEETNAISTHGMFERIKQAGPCGCLHPVLGFPYHYFLIFCWTSCFTFNILLKPFWVLSIFFLLRQIAGEMEQHHYTVSYHEETPI